LEISVGRFLRPDTGQEAQRRFTDRPQIFHQLAIITSVLKVLALAMKVKSSNPIAPRVDLGVDAN
jgi:hypothetical protein